MRMRPFWIALGFLFVPTIANADAHRWGFYGAGSYANASNLFGFHLAGDVAVRQFTTRQGWYKDVVLIGDYSIHAGEHGGADVRVKTFQGGGGFRKSHPSMPKLALGVHAIYGKTLGDAGRFTQTYGGMIEFAPHRVENGWDTAFRVQYDLAFPNGDDPNGAENNFQRLSFGGVIRFNKARTATGGTTGK